MAYAGVIFSILELQEEFPFNHKVYAPLGSNPHTPTTYLSEKLQFYLSCSFSDFLSSMRVFCQ